MSERIFWSANSSRHDWRAGGPLHVLVTAAARLGLIGRPQRLENDYPHKERLLAAQPGEELVAAMLLSASAQGRATEIAIAGDDPAPWWLFWNTYPFDANSGWVDGLNNLSLTFDRSRIAGRAGSDALAAAFLSAHTPADTEYAFIHPYVHWAGFSHANYGNPVTINISFRGVFWANFLGPGHLDEFDVRLLQDLDAHRVEWVDNKGLFVIATPDLASADAPASEPVLIRLTERFRAALRPDSRWR